jgi:alkylated DNA repair dioxygenase AlkB
MRITQGNEPLEYRKRLRENLKIQSKLSCWSVEEPLMSGLFEETNRLEAIPLPDAEVYYQSEFDLGRHPDEILRELISDVPWRQHKILVWGKMHLQPRLVAWYGDPDTEYTYSGITLEPMPWTCLLLEIRRRVEDATAASFNSVLLNYYRDNRDSMGFHSDFEPVLGDRPVIASVSLGEERTFILKHKTNKLAKPVRLKLASGSVLLMKGETQRYWQHGVAKLARPCGPRINLTFRRIDMLDT